MQRTILLLLRVKQEQAFLLLKFCSMLDTNADERIAGRQRLKTMPYFMLLMSLVYMALGAFVIAAPAGMIVLSQQSKRIVGALFILYGLIRFVRTFRQHFRKRHDSF
ncbi:hypothetical protein B0919_00910 [Hymenobacter sp. CRA2]|nr:hypothetical protein B0919_00910 [Hymenobacter sp. CRA2]